MKKRNYIILDVVRSDRFNLNLSESTLASYLYGLIAQFEPIQYNGSMYYMADYKYVIENCPIITNKIDTLRRLYKNLENIGLIRIIKIGNRIHFSPSKDLREWGLSCDIAEINPLGAEINPLGAEINPLGAEINPLGAEINPLGAEINPLSTLYSINNSNINSNIKSNINSNKKDIPSNECISKASDIFGFNSSNLGVSDNVIKKANKIWPNLAFPFDSDEFKRSFYILLCQPKWNGSKKTQTAIQSNLNSLSKYPEEFALILVSDSIRNGWGALEYDSTEQKFKKWELSKIGTSSIVDNKFTKEEIHNGIAIMNGELF